MSGPVIARWFSTVLDQTKPPAPVWRCSYVVTASHASGLCKAASRPGANAAIPWQLFLGSAQPVSVPKSLPLDREDPVSIKIQVTFYSRYGHVCRIGRSSGRGRQTSPRRRSLPLSGAPSSLRTMCSKNTVPRPLGPVLPRCQWPRSISLPRPTRSFSVRQFASET